MPLLILLCLVCAPRTLPAQGVMRVRVERIEPGRWRATYVLPVPVVRLRFRRPAAFYRERIWSVVTPGYRLAREGDRQVAVLEPGARPAHEVVFEFPQFTDPLPKEYELFQPFSDGSVALYTGHFTAMAFGAADSLPVDRLEVRTPDGGHAVVRGEVVEGLVTWSDPADENGTYIYLGRGRPIVTPDVIAIVDPGMPAWLDRMLRDHLPALFAHYRDGFGIPLPAKPVVLYSFHDTVASGLSSGGGTLTGLITMTLTGEEWRTPGPAAAEQAVSLIAHESAHLWNGQLVTNADGGTGSWMHEGGADAMADEMLLTLGIIDSAGYRARREGALNRCALAVTAGPVTQALARGAIRAVYDCGVVMAIWTEAALRRVRPGATLFSFWRDLVQAARVHDGRYDQDLYFTTLQGAGVPPSVVADMRSFLDGRIDVGAAVAAMATAGVAVTPGRGDPPPDFQLELSRGALVHLMTQACGYVDIYWGIPVRTGAVPSCPPFAKELRVFGVQGARMRDQGAAVYDAIQAACAAGTTVTLDAEDGTALSSVTCARALPARPAWYALGGQVPAPLVEP